MVQTQGELAPTRPVPAYKAPEEAKKKKAKDGVSETKVPQHGVASDVAGDDQACKAQGQQAMEKAGWQIPDANGHHKYFR